MVSRKDRLASLLTVLDEAKQLADELLEEAKQIETHAGVAPGRNKDKLLEQKPSSCGLRA